MAGGRDGRRRRRLQADREIVRVEWPRDLELHPALTHVHAVGDGARSHQHGAGGRLTARIHAHRELVAPGECAGMLLDARTLPDVERGRRVDLGGVEARDRASGHRVVVIAGGEHPAVGEQERGRVIGAILDLRRTQPPSLGLRVEDLDLATHSGWIHRPVAGGSRDSHTAAHRHHRAVGQQDRVVVGPIDLEAWSGRPAGGRVPVVERLDRGRSEGASRSRPPPRGCRRSSSPSRIRRARRIAAPRCRRHGYG